MEIHVLGDRNLNRPFGVDVLIGDHTVMAASQNIPQ